MTERDDTIRDLFGDLAQSVGLSRPAGQCFAAIWRAPQAPCADDLVAALGLARSNVSTALKELRGWNLVSVARIPGDRKEYFTAPADPWELLRLVLAARQRHVTARLLDRVISAEAAAADVRLAALHDALSQIDATMTALAQLPAGDFARRFLKLPETADEKPRKKKKKR